jgi:hypothetical protein
MRYKIFFPLFLAMISMLTFSQQSGDKKTGHPDDNLPGYIRKICGFGERPDWSHDGKKILFVEKPMGEVYELSIETGEIISKTRHFLHYGFTRAMYMANGDILLAGPVKQFDAKDLKSRDIARDQCWLFVLDKGGTKQPVPLNRLCAEGPALSRKTMKIAWAERDRQKPELGKNRALLLTGEIVYNNGIPEIKNEKVVFDSKQLPFALGNSSLETQNLVPGNEDLLTFAVYTINDGNNTDAYLLDMKTGEYKALTSSPTCYDEPEGIFPDGKFTCVEHGNSTESAWPMIDLYKLKLDGSGEMQRLTHFTEYKGFKASQGVVSDDGRYLSFQIGKSGDEAGVGYGFYILDLEKAAAELGPFEKY